MSDRQRALVEGQADGRKDRDAASSGGLEDGPDIGVEFGPPFRAKAIRDLAEDDTGTESLLGAVIGWRDLTVGDEDE